MASPELGSEARASTEELLLRAWPDGIPLGEAAYLRSLAEKRRAVVMARLEAVLAAEGDTIGLVEAARLAGVGRTAFFLLRRAWNTNKSLRALAPYERRQDASKLFVEPAKRRGKMSRFQVGERTAAVEAIRADPSASNGAIAALVAERTASSLDRRTLISLVRKERRLLHFSPQLLIGVYGRSLVADVSALDMTLDDGGEGQAAIAAFLVERSTGLVLGHAVGERNDGIELQRRAAERALAFLAMNTADVAIGTDVAMTLVVGPGSGGEVDALSTLARSVPGVEVVSAGRFRFGRKVSSLIGRPGRIALRPMATMPADNERELQGDHPPVTAAEGDALLGAELERHNRSALDALGMVGLAGGGVERGAIARLIGQVFRVGPEAV